MKKSNIAIVLTIFFNVALLLFLFIKFPNVILSLGGSVILISIISGLVVLGISIRPLTTESIFIMLMITGIGIMNFLGYLEMTNRIIGFSNFPKFLYCVIGIFIFFMLAFIWLVRPQDISSEESGRSLRNKLILTLSASLFIAITFIAPVMPTWLDQFVQRTHFFNVTNLSVFFIILGLVVSLVYLSKIKDEEIERIVNKKKYHLIKFDPSRFKKYLKLCFLLMIGLGSIIEIKRGLWVLWTETILMLALFFLILWKVYKHVFNCAEQNEEHR